MLEKGSEASEDGSAMTKAKKNAEDWIELEMIDKRTAPNIAPNTVQLKNKFELLIDDNDDDNDGLMDWFEVNDGNSLTGQFDSDNDGLDDHEDDDDDNDGILDIYEF